MKLRLLTLLAALLLCAPGHAQTIKSLGYNTTNGFVVYSGTNPLTFTNSLQFATNARAATRTNLGGTSVGDAVFTATNAAAGATALELGATNNVTFNNLTTSGTLTATGNVTLSGVGNTAPSQTASSGSSLMTRDLGDARYGERTVLYLTNFVSVTNSTTPVDTPLSVALPVGNYLVRSALFAENAVAAPGHAFQFGFTGTSSPQRLLGQIGSLSASGIRLDFPLTVTRSVSNSFITTVNVEGYVKVTVTGTLTVKYAQQTATTNVSQLKEGFLEVIKLP